MVAVENAVFAFPKELVGAALCVHSSGSFHGPSVKARGDRYSTMAKKLRSILYATEAAVQRVTRRLCHLPRISILLTRRLWQLAPSP